MSAIQFVFTVISAIVLFLHGLQGFSQEIRTAFGESLTRFMGRFTQNRFRGFAMGAVFTALIQSSSAASALTVALVDAGTITLRGSLGLLIGANVGTSSTAWLVSFKLTGIGPYFIVLGTLLGFVPHRVRIVGKVLFYFGFIFFALDLLSASLAPLRDYPAILELFSSAGSPYFAVLVGLVVTAIVQSSSVTTGLAILLTQQGLMHQTAAIAIVIGANIGTTSTSLVASIGMGRTARRAALANLLFNVGGVLIILPVLPLFAKIVDSLVESRSQTVAMAHLLFNLVTATVFLLGMRYFETILMRLMPHRAEDSAGQPSS
jgi:phosphate:Na+ symporter